jgi:hypothetical protein
VRRLLPSIGNHADVQLDPFARRSTSAFASARQRTSARVLRHSKKGLWGRIERDDGTSTSSATRA